MKKLKSMTKDERSLLLFLEARADDYGGRVNIQHMNAQNMILAEKWSKEGFLGFGRIVIRNHNLDGTHWVKLSDEAWKLAHEERRNRNRRMWDNKTFLGTKESSEMYGSPHTSGMNALKGEFLFVEKQNEK